MKPNQDLKEISGYIVRTFSVPREKVEVWEKFEQIALREIKAKVVRSKSELIIKIIEEYVKEHQEGNPQLRLDRTFIAKTKGPICSRCGSSATRIYFTEGGRFFVCDVHRRGLRVGSGNIKGWKKL